MLKEAFKKKKKKKLYITPVSSFFPIAIPTATIETHLPKTLLPSRFLYVKKR